MNSINGHNIHHNNAYFPGIEYKTEMIRGMHINKPITAILLANSCNGHTEYIYNLPTKETVIAIKNKTLVFLSYVLYMLVCTISL